jgi:hypothetical protein
MHPVMTEKLAAERIREMVARGDAARRARGAHRARHDQQAQGRRAAAGPRGAGRPAADWAAQPVISVRSADGIRR